MRGQIPGILAARATEAGCRELLRLASTLPEQSTWLRWTYRDAVQNVRRNSGTRLTPETVTSVLKNRHARLLNCDDDLLELVLESLERLQKTLTGQTLPALEDLWCWEGRGNHRRDFCPKDEEALSDYIARWLSSDIGSSAGVVVGREMQIRRSRKTDIFLEAVSAGEGGFKKLTVIIEVKGCWHREVKEALRTQLAEDYLRPHGLRCGVYLVGWFVCDRWKKPENKLASSDFESAQGELAATSSKFHASNPEFQIETFLLNCTF